MKSLFKKRYRTDSFRLPEHHYTHGTYFITVCTYQHLHFFGKIANDEMHYSELGNYACNALLNFNRHRYISMIESVVMPNHIHFLFKLSYIADCPDSGGNIYSKISKQRKGVSLIVSSLKAKITRYANLHKISFKWQKGFYDTVIKDEAHLNNVVKYIRNNIKKWDSDEYNPFSILKYYK